MTTDHLDIRMKLSKQRHYPAVMEMISALYKGLQDRFQNTEFSKSLTSCTNFDQRFKAVAFQD